METGLTALPEELIVRTLTFCALPALVALMRTCKPFHALVGAQDAIWDALSAARFGTADPDAEADARLEDLSSMLGRASLVEDEATMKATQIPWRALQTAGLSLVGGLSNYVRLHHARGQLAECLQTHEGDISNLGFPVDVIAFPSNEWLENPGFGSARTIFRAAGPQLAAHIRERWQVETDPSLQLPPLLEQGAVVVTPAFGLQAKWLCHCVGINWIGPHGFDLGPDRLERKVADQAAMIERCFEMAIQHGAKSIAIPGISTGARRFPPDIVALMICQIAKRRIIESGFELKVHCISYGAVSLHQDFMRARAGALSPLVQ
jgi:O-acetyl-ADP-ribose deacetylase (regulator of RNase III)